ncbi:hypothetical protein ACNQGL_08790 [Flavobacterium sp. LB3P21]|uniref:hypothetical protein n=1 Tax=Flavobacterium sp. LB3P21 TaxID=3401719 RepID=UPI003AAFC7C3
MILNNKTLEKLRLLINEETEYRSGPQLVSFFNSLGSRDVYSQGFPSRWIYTDNKLNLINGTPDLDKCIKLLFAPVNFIGKYEILDKHISSFNEYLAFDDWKVIRIGKEISFTKADKINFETKKEVNEEDFINQEFDEISIFELNLDGIISDILSKRILEIKANIKANAPLSAVVMIGSTLEGILLGFASKNPKDFNQANAAPKDKEGKTKLYQDWSLSSFIDVAYELRFIQEDVKKFSHSLRDFRNYIHPFEQMSSGFNPDINTAKLCWNVLKVAIIQLSNKK